MYKNINSIPKTVELFGRTIKTKMIKDLRVYGQAEYGINEIAVASSLPEGRSISDEEKKLTYLHELFHFILNFTCYEDAIRNNSKIDLEQFVELMASAIYQYEKTAKY